MGIEFELTVLESGELDEEGRRPLEPDLEGREDSCTVLETGFRKYMVYFSYMVMEVFLVAVGFLASWFEVDSTGVS